MNKYIVFAVCFIVIFFIFQVVSGMLLTVIHAPDIDATWNMASYSSQQTIIQSNSFIPTFLFAFLSATTAYFITGKVKD